MTSDTCISPVTRFLLRRICWKLVLQGPLHKRRITEYYRIMQEAAQEEFFEDFGPSVDAFLKECHAEALGGRA